MPRDIRELPVSVRRELAEDAHDEAPGCALVMAGLLGLALAAVLWVGFGWLLYHLLLE